MYFCRKKWFLISGLRPVCRFRLGYGEIWFGQTCLKSQILWLPDRPPTNYPVIPVAALYHPTRDR